MLTVEGWKERINAIFHILPQKVYLHEAHWIKSRRTLFKVIYILSYAFCVFLFVLLANFLGGNEQLQPLSWRLPGPGVCNEHRSWPPKLFLGVHSKLYIYVRLCYTIEVASFIRFRSYLVHNFAVGVSQNRKLITQFKNRGNKFVAS